MDNKQDNSNNRIKKLAIVLGNLWRGFWDSKLGAVINFVLSDEVSRIVTLGTVGLGLAGVIPFVTPALAIPIAAVAVTGVIAGIVIDTLKTRSNRRLLKERKALKMLNRSITKGQKILNANPGLKEVLGENLLITDKQNLKKNIDLSEYSVPKSITKSAFNQAAYIPLMIVQSMTNPWYLAVNTIRSIVGLSLEVNERRNIAQIRNDVKQEINKEREKAPDYSSLQELKQIERAQRIKIMALQEIDNWISKEKINIKSLTNEEIHNKFNNAKSIVENKVKKVAKTNNVTSVMMNFSRALNPFYRKYKSAAYLEKTIKKEDMKISGYNPDFCAPPKSDLLLRSNSKQFPSITNNNTLSHKEHPNNRDNIANRPSTTHSRGL